MNRDPRVRSLLEDLRRECRAGEATLWLGSREDLKLTAVTNAGPDPRKLEGLQVPIDDSLVGMVLCTGMATALGPDANYHPAAQTLSGVPTAAMAAAPVQVNGFAVGVLSMINPTDRALFSSEDLATVQRKALRIGQVLGETGRAS